MISPLNFFLVKNFKIELFSANCYTALQKTFYVVFGQTEAIITKICAKNTP
jgi:hypothetical protein